MLAPLVSGALVVLAFYLYTKLRRLRFEKFRGAPQPGTSLVWGHMKVFNDFLTSSRPGAHPDEAMAAIYEQLGSPPIVLLDLWPASWPIVLVANHEAAERVTKATKLFPWSTPKSPTMGALVYLTGARSLLNQEGQEWKHLRKMFNPGFAPTHLLGMLPAILNKTSIFLDRLEQYAETGEEVPLLNPLISLTFDIIGAVVMDADFNAQQVNDEDKGELIRVYNELTSTYTDVLGSSPWWFTPRAEFRRRRLAGKIDSLIKPIIRAEHAKRLESGQAKRSRSVLGLSLQGIDELTEGQVSDICDQIKTFLFAGHDTTSILLSWIFYELSRNPRAKKAVREELDQIFGPDSNPASVRDKLLAPGGEELVGRMTYISAVIKEALRLHPPASSARMTPPGSGFTLPTGTGEEFCVDGCVIYVCASIIQRDRNVYGDTADDFMPERWIGDSDTSEKTNTDAADVKGDRKVPISAWRPFERGPRNCIGQELANIEARVILAVLARSYDFVKVGMGEFDLDGDGKPMLNEKGQYKVKSELYSAIQVTSKPVDGMRMKVKRASMESA